MGRCMQASKFMLRGGGERVRVGDSEGSSVREAGCCCFRYECMPQSFPLFVP